MVLAMVPDAPPTWKNRRATSWPAPISAKVPYFLASRLIWNAFLLVPTSISAFIRTQDVDICVVLNPEGAFPPGREAARRRPRVVFRLANRGGRRGRAIPPRGVRRPYIRTRWAAVAGIQ